jgi:hypothetical protein
MDLCVACSVFLFDWLCRPSTPTDYFARHIRRAYLEKAIPDLLPEIHRLLSKVNELMKYMITSKVKGELLCGRQTRMIPSLMCLNHPMRLQYEKELLELEWRTTVRLFREHVSREDIDYLLQMIDEHYILDSATTSELWLGMTLSMMMKELPLIHAGHSGGTLDTAASAMSGLICTKEHAAARAMFEGDPDADADDLYA